MSKIKLTKGELKRQRDALKQFSHFLPVLQLKKQQLQMEIFRVRSELKRKVHEIDVYENEISEWAGLLNEGTDFIAPSIKGEAITSTANIAGIGIPVFERIDFEDAEYDFFETPLWTDMAIEKLRKLKTLLAEEDVLKSQIEVLQKELRMTTQRVNLFEKVKIPECRENIRLIKIYLGDQQTNAVGRSKIAKNKIRESVAEEVHS